MALHSARKLFARLVPGFLTIPAFSKSRLKRMSLDTGSESDDGQSTPKPRQQGFLGDEVEGGTATDNDSDETEE